MLVGWDHFCLDWNFSANHGKRVKHYTCLFKFVMYSTATPDCESAALKTFPNKNNGIMIKIHQVYLQQNVPSYIW